MPGGERTRGVEAGRRRHPPLDARSSDADVLGNDDAERFRPPPAAPVSALSRACGLLVLRGAGAPSCASKSKLYGSSSSPPPPKKLAFFGPLAAVVDARPPPPLLVFLFVWRKS